MSVTPRRRKLSVDGRPLNEVVCDAIRADIISGMLAPGLRLAEERLAQEYSVSRNPIREAIRRLESEGFVIVLPNRGATVARMDDDKAQELLQVRAALETVAVRLATERADPEVLAELRAIVASGRAAIERDDSAVLPELNSQFHTCLASASGNATLAGMIAQLRDKLTWVYATDLATRAEDSWDEHGEIVETIAAGDPVAAAARMEAHITNAEHAYVLRHEARTADP
jgi:DNA-binding GntR family transcriptional regulator